MPVTVVVGAQWGDEGKGKIVDLLSGGFSAVVRFRTFEAEDIATLAEQICEVPISPEGIKFIHERGSGKFRRTMVWFSRAETLAKRNKLAEITLEHLKTLTQGRTR